MQRTTDFHHEITDTLLAETRRVVRNATALDAAADVLDAHAPAGDAPIAGFLRTRKGRAPRLLGRHDDLDVRECTRKKAQILEQRAARG